MMERSLTPSSLARLAGKTPADAAQIRAMSAALFHRDDDPWIVARLSDLRKNKLQSAIEIGEDLYGPLTQKDVRP